MQKIVFSVLFGVPQITSHMRCCIVPGSNHRLFPLELLLANGHCLVIEILFVQMIVSW